MWKRTSGGETKRRRGSTPVAVLALTLIVASARGQDEPPERALPLGAIANDRVSLAAAAQAQEPAVPLAPAAGIDPAGEAPPDPPSAEAQALGHPGGILTPSAPPPEAAGEPGWSWRELDPRRNQTVRVFGALALVLGLLLLTRAVLKRTGHLVSRAGRPSGVVDILARYPIGRGQQLMLLKLGRRLLLVHQSGGTMQTLTEVTGTDEVAALLSRIEAGSRGREAVRFRQLLNHHEAEVTGHLAAAPRSAPRGSRPGNEVVDLTRAPVRGLRRLAARGRLAT